MYGVLMIDCMGCVTLTRHKLIRSKKYPTRRVELCPNCNKEMRKSFDRVSGGIAKVCIKCKFTIIDYKQFDESDFVTYSK